MSEQQMSDQQISVQQLSRLRDQYQRIAIPEGLDTVVQDAMRRAGIRPYSFRSRLRGALVAAAAVVCLFTIAVNAVPALAATMENVPILGRIVQVLTFTNLRASQRDQGYDININVPQISGLADAALQDRLNQQYLAKAREMYGEFVAGIGGLEEGQLAHKALEAGYKVKVHTEELMVIEHWKVEIAASGTESVKYDTIDLRHEVLITLPSLFRDDGYVRAISASILAQMKTRMANDPEVMFFTNPDDPWAFRQIAADQTFYMNEERELVIVFDEYAVAPGCMGVVEFVIPTDVIADHLVGSGYIR